MANEIVLVRHGETEWSREGRHTGRTDVPLTEVGREQADLLRPALEGRRFARVLTSPLLRAADTARVAGYDAEPREELREWDYGAYEGRKTADIREERTGWTLWRDGVPSGEPAAEVADRVDRVLDELREVGGDALIFAHGHLLRVLAARWLGLQPEAGRLLALDPATISVLGHERETPVIRVWNAPIAPEKRQVPQTRRPAGLDGRTLSQTGPFVKGDLEPPPEAGGDQESRASQWSATALASA